MRILCLVALVVLCWLLWLAVDCEARGIPPDTTAVAQCDTVSWEAYLQRQIERVDTLGVCAMCECAVVDTIYWGEFPGLPYQELIAVGAEILGDEHFVRVVAAGDTLHFHTHCFGDFVEFMTRRLWRRRIWEAREGLRK